VTNGVLVRDATVEDAGAIGTVHVRTWQAAYAGLVDQAHLDQLSVDDRVAWWAERLAEQRQVVLVAEMGGAVVGFVTGGPSRDHDADGAWGVYAVYVAPSAWGMGAGRALLDAFLDRVPPAVPRLTLWVLDTNEQARAFYERAGMRVDGAAKPDRIGGSDVVEVRYRIELGQ
jgi:RimJ/RimL family protein N-acetyltransferase